ncbi:MAG TPA: cation:proton antiporter [Rhizomicrobium sp.]|jgi:Kef-type K+ transport system membrane component KefB/nucleotide-binding universal stress UspA family protein|nr:cation:proton antiporter [Rhizomicrobium sp.]
MIKSSKFFWRGPLVLIATALIMCTASHAWAAAGGAAGGHAAAGAGGKKELIFVAELVLLMVVGRLMGELMQRIKQPPLMGNLLAGLLLGPSVFGLIWPDAQHAIFPTDPDQKSMIAAMSQFGILLLLMLTGMETDLKLVKKVGKAAIFISVAGVAVPFACGFTLGQFLPASILPSGGGRLVPSLFLGTALAISSVKIVALVVREMNFMRRNLGQVIVASAIIEDTIGWVIIAITFGIATAGKVDVLSLAKTVGGVFLFMAFSFTIGRRIVFFLIRWANDSFRSEFPVITMILVIMGSMAMITSALGVQTVLGAFVAGILIGESPILTDHIEGQLRGIITALFMPVFFGLAGLTADLSIMKHPDLLLVTGALILIASVGKFTGAFLGGTMGGLSTRESLALGCGMNARGSTEVIVATIGLSMGMLTQNLFTMIVAMAFITTMAMPPMLRAALARVPLGKGEKERIEREELDESGFVSRLERLLIAVDDSLIGKYAARIAGLIAGAQGMPTTILRVGNSEDTAPSPGQNKKAKGEGPEREVKTGAKAGAASAREAEKSADPEKVHIATQKTAESKAPAKAVADEARKGYDLLLIGLGNGHDKDGNFSGEINQLAKGFNGPIAIATTDNGDEPKPLNGRAKILVPVNGTEPSRRAAEVAFALARPTRATVVALYVSQVAARKNSPAQRNAKRNEEAVLKDISDLADRYDITLRTRIALKGSPQSVIQNELQRGYALLVIGVNQRPGEELFFGDTANNVLIKAKGPILLVANRPATAARKAEDEAESDEEKQQRGESSVDEKEPAAA